MAVVANIAGLLLNFGEDHHRHARVGLLQRRMTPVQLITKQQNRGLSAHAGHTVAILRQTGCPAV